jgi:hypothetical protein
MRSTPAPGVVLRALAENVVRTRSGQARLRIGRTVRRARPATPGADVLPHSVQ